ncbi:hypothetical protein [Variovorax rhizosphaerae]|uniref:HEAT repeat domain-containing protein n=1 Tax=Variovorax rhizosphaerae TaxID=1836200 RepID=A0ABU8X1B2_9BURK
MKKAGLLAVVAVAVAGIFYWSQTQPLPGTAPQQSSPAPVFHRDDRGPSAAAARYATEIGAARDKQDSQNPLASYVPRPGIEGRNELDRIFAQSVLLTTRSALAAHALLKAGISNDEKIALARILGRLYSPDNLTGYNSDLLLDLRTLIGDDNKDVARSAALSFSRLGYLPGSDALLKTAFDSRVLSADDYYGELAHMAPLAPAGVQDELVSMIRSSANPYAADILAGSINNDPSILRSYSERSIANIGEFLRNSEPRFASATGDFGLTDAVRYANWLRASAKVDSLSHGTDLDTAIVAQLTLPGTDPRKITAYLLMPEASSILSSALLGSPAGGLVSASNQYAAQYPGNMILQSAAQEIGQRIGRSRGKP